MDMSQIFENSPAAHFSTRNCHNGLHQLIAPIFHEDGDMMNIYLEETQDGAVRLSDQGMSLMRLSYLFDIDTDNKRKILNDIILGRGGEFDNGNINLTVPSSNIFSGIMSFSQMVSQIENMHILSHENISSLFYENVMRIISEFKLPFRCEKDYRIPVMPELPIDYAFFGTENKKPVYLFAVKDTHKAQQSAICCLKLSLNKIPSRSAVVFENMDDITRFARYSLVDAASKIFATVEGFKEKGAQYLEDELAS